MKTSIPLKNLFARFSYGNRPRPSRDWFLLLTAATFLIVLSIGWNLWLLRSVEEGGVIGNEAPASSFDARPIEEIRAVFESRSLEELKYRQQYRFVDPSL